MYTLDAVMNEFNQTPPNVTKYRDMELELLSGTGAPAADWIGGLGEIAPRSTATETLLNFQRKYLAKFEAGTATKADFDEYSKIRMAIMANGTPEQAGILAIMPYVQRVNANGIFVFKSDFINRLQFLPETISEAEMTTDDRNTLLGLASAIDNSSAFADLDELSGIDDEFSGLGKKFKDTKVGKALKKVGKALKKVAPPLVAARAAWLLIAKTNIKKVGYKLAVGYMTEAEAKAKNIPLATWRKLVKFREKSERAFEKAGGNKKNLRKAALKSKAAKRLGLRGVEPGQTLGEVVTATAIASAAVPVVLAVIAKLSKESGTEGDLGLDMGVEENINTASLDNNDGFDTNDQREISSKAAKDFAQPDPTPGENPPANDKKDYTLYYVLGGITLLGIGAYAMGGKKRGK